MLQLLVVLSADLKDIPSRPDRETVLFAQAGSALPVEMSSPSLRDSQGTHSAGAVVGELKLELELVPQSLPRIWIRTQSA